MRTPSPFMRWYILAVLTLANVCGFVDRQVLSLLVVPIERDLGISDTQMSYLLGLSFAVFYSVLGLPIARWADRANRRTIIAGGVALWSVMTMLSGLARTYRRLLWTRIGVGVGEATLNAPAVSLLADSFPADRLGVAMSVYSLGVFLGSGLAYFIGGWAVSLVAGAERWVWPVIGAVQPWQSVFLIVGAPGLGVALLLLTIRDPRSSRARAAAASPVSPASPASAPSAASAAEPRPASSVTLFRHVWAHRRAFVAHHLGFALSATVNYGIAAWLATYFVRRHGWTPARAGMVQGVLTMTVGVAGVLVGGRVADWLGRRGRVDAPLRVGIIGAIGMLVSASAYPLMPSATGTVAWLVIVNFFAAFPWGAATAAIAVMVPAPMRAQGAALYFLVLNLVSAALGPTAVAVVTEFVFRDPASLGYALAVVNAAGMTGTIVVLRLGLHAYVGTVELVRRAAAASVA